MLGSAGARVNSEILERRTTSARDIVEIAALHRRELPASNISKLGRTGAEAFYRFAVASPHESVFAVRVDGRLRAGAVLSWSPHTLSKRLALRSLRDIRLACAVAAGLPGMFFGTSKRNVSDGDVAEAPERFFKAADLAPELSLIFADRDIRGQRLGARLLDVLENVLRASGTLVYFARTNADLANPAISFYARSGFTRIGYAHDKQKILLAMKKAIAP